MKNKPRSSLLLLFLLLATPLVAQTNIKDYNIERFAADQSFLIGSTIRIRFSCRSSDLAADQSGEAFLGSIRDDGLSDDSVHAVRVRVPKAGISWFRAVPLSTDRTHSRPVRYIYGRITSSGDSGSRGPYLDLLGTEKRIGFNGAAFVWPGQ